MIRSPVIVLGTHGGGTSLAASILDALGVKMGYNPNLKVTVPKWTYTNFEDSSFMRLNTAIMKSFGGEWFKPPLLSKMRMLELRHEERFLKMITQRATEAKGALWGWKDPRNAITIHLLHRLMVESHFHSLEISPCYLVVRRDSAACARSIQSRGQSKRTFEDWLALSKEHYRRIDFFLEEAQPDYLTVTFGGLVKKSKLTIQRIASFFEIEKPKVGKALKRVKR